MSQLVLAVMQFAAQWAVQRSRAWPGRRRWMALVLVGMLAGAPPWVQARPQVWAQMDQIALDNPHAALRWADQQLRSARLAGDHDTEFWLLLGAAYAQNALELAEGEDTRLRAAEQLLDEWPQATPLHQAWLGAARALQSLRALPAATLEARLAALRREATRLQARDLACELDGVSLWVMVYAGSRDDAWSAGEALERCAHEVGNLDLEISAVMQLGVLASQVSGKIAAAGQAEDYFRRALALLGARPARFVRSVIEWQYGNALVFSRQPEAAREHFLAAQALSQDLHDDAGVAAAMLKVGELTLADGDALTALQLARRAQHRLAPQQNQARLLVAHTLVVRALTLLHRPAVLVAIDQARALDTPQQLPARRAALAAAMAAGYASQAQYAQAYAELKRAERLNEDNKEGLRDTQLLRLQASYEGARREAENAELRRRSETARLELVAQAATRRALWAALLALVLLLAGAVLLGLRGWRKRRYLAELALRDELTGLPNRRAIQAFGEAQLAQAHQWQQPFSAALIDLDHFKQVNDSLGHAGGDAVLQALARAAEQVLRGRDRLGRMGGEEFLLLMPGTAQYELPAVFERLRSAFSHTPIPGLPTPHGIRFSMGGAELQRRIHDLPALIAQADRALYTAKAAGRDQLALARLPEAAEPAPA